jgi:porin
MAQPDFEVVNTTETQTDFNRKYNLVNLLSLSVGLPSEKINSSWTNGSFNIQLISTNKIYKERIADDLMTFSNIEEDNLPINAFLLGYTHRWRKISLFGGVRNVNNDYFITPYTSLFSNSSAGIFPTLSINFPLANYPLSAMCLHLEYEPTKYLLFKSSLYNGIAHDPRKNVFKSFSVNPRADGIFSISELNFTQDKIGNGHYALGITANAWRKNSKPAYTLWEEIEQTLINNNQKEIGLIIHSGFAPSMECRYYYAVGGYFSGLLTKRKQDRLGIYLNKAGFSTIKERTLEITWQYQITNLIAIQPTFQCIRTGNKTTNIGLLRLIFTYD